MMTTIVVGIGCSVLGAVLYQLGTVAWKNRWKRNLRKLLEFPRDQDLYFVYPPRRGGEEGLLPRTSTEDFMAINNLISSLLSIGWDSDRFVVRDTGRITADQKLQNLLIMCSPKSNKLAGEVQDALLERGVRFFYFARETIGGMEQSVVTTQGGGVYPSPAARIEQKHAQEGKEGPLHAEALQDFAVITKVRNPWNPQSRVLWVAGIRGIGTWGAAETLKKWHGKLHSVMRRTRAWQTGSYSALLRISYNNSDIVDSSVVNFISIDDKPGE